MLGASPHSDEASANQTTPIRNTRRRPARSPSEPPSRISAASVRVYAVTVHCNPASDACRCLPIVGSATLTTVESSNTMLDPSTVAISTQRPRALFSRNCGASTGLLRSLTLRCSHRPSGGDRDTARPPVPTTRSTATRENSAREKLPASQRPAKPAVRFWARPAAAGWTAVRQPIARNPAAPSQTHRSPTGPNLTAPNQTGPSQTGQRRASARRH
jgi:hypothetical protein